MRWVCLVRTGVGERGGGGGRSVASGARGSAVAMVIAERVGKLFRRALFGIPLAVRDNTPHTVAGQDLAAGAALDTNDLSDLQFSKDYITTLPYQHLHLALRLKPIHLDTGPY